jgi:hypothetical protein
MSRESEKKPSASQWLGLTDWPGAASPKKSWPRLDFPQGPQPPDPPLPPKFPEIYELLDEPMAPPRRQKGLFEELLHNRADILLSDAQAHEGKYSDDVVSLLTDLYTKKKKVEDLQPEERQLLDEATLFFAQYDDPDKKPKKASVKKAEEAADDEGDEDLSEDPPEGAEDLPNHWWKR